MTFQIKNYGAEDKYSTANRISSSDKEVPPRGGIAPFPLIALLTSASMPADKRLSHAAASPIAGAFSAAAVAAPWQAMQTVSASCLPDLV